MITNIAFAQGTVTVTRDDGTTEVFTTAPVVTDEKITVTHADGSTEDFTPATPAVQA